jgi:hypothetical protein
MDFIYNSVGSSNGFDGFGHFLRSNLQITGCVEVAPSPQGPCQANFPAATTTTTTPKAKKKGKKAVRKARAHLRPRLPLPPIDVPDLSQLLPQVAPDQSGSSDGSHSDSGSDSGTTTTTPDTSTNPDDRSANSDVSMKSARMFLNFLLGGGA